MKLATTPAIPTDAMRFVSPNSSSTNSAAGSSVELNLHATDPRSRANGPGTRYVVWFQGCDLGCPECFNPRTHPFVEVRRVAARRLADDVAAALARLDGLTLSGGEPFQQPQGLLEFLRALRQQVDSSVLVFSGYTLEEIAALPTGPETLEHVDVLVAGRYVASRYVGAGLLGSSNQKIHLLSERHSLEELRATPQAEVRIESDGVVRASGIRPPRLGGRGG